MQFSMTACLFYMCSSILGLTTNSRKPLQYSQIGKTIEITGCPVPITPRRLRAISFADLMTIKQHLNNISIRYATHLCADTNCDIVMTMCKYIFFNIALYSILNSYPNVNILQCFRSIQQKVPPPTSSPTTGPLSNQMQHQNEQPLTNMPPATTQSIEQIVPPTLNQPAPMQSDTAPMNQNQAVDLSDTAELLTSATQLLNIDQYYNGYPTTI